MSKVYFPKEYFDLINVGTTYQLPLNLVSLLLFWWGIRKVFWHREGTWRRRAAAGPDGLLVVHRLCVCFLDNFLIISLCSYSMDWSSSTPTNISITCGVVVTALWSLIISLIVSNCTCEDWSGCNVFSLIYVISVEEHKNVGIIWNV